MEVRPKTALIIFIIAFLFCAGSLIAKHLSFRTRAYDTGILGGVARHAAFQLSFYNDVENANYLGQHFSPALFLGGLLFYIWDNAAILSIYQNICVFLSIMLAFILAKKILKSNKWAILLSFIYAANYYLQNVNEGSYHTETLALPLFFCLFILM